MQPLVFAQQHRLAPHAQLKAHMTMTSDFNDITSIREQAVSVDGAATERISLASLWNELKCGEARVVDTFFTRDRCYVTVEPRPPEPNAELCGRRLFILHSILCGHGQKRVAIELELAPSSVALNARLALAAIGVRDRPSRANPLLMLAAMSYCAEDYQRYARLSRPDGADGLRVISVPRPERAMKRMLPPAELDVVRSLVEGLPYTDISRLRGTSTRTIANQITAVFRRLKVSGRNELIHWLFLHEPAEAAAPAATVPPDCGPVTRLAPGSVGDGMERLQRYA